MMVPGHRHLDRGQHRVDGVGDLQEVGQEDKQLVVAAPAHRLLERGRQHADLGGGGVQVFAAGAVQGLLERHLVLVQEALRLQHELLIVLQQQGRAAGAQVMPQRQDRRQLLAPAVGFPVGDRQPGEDALVDNLTRVGQAPLQALGEGIAARRRPAQRGGRLRRP